MQKTRSTSARLIPPVVRSRQDLIDRGESFLGPGAVAPAKLPITQDGATYSMAQEAAWIDSRHFAVGRWDGSMSIFAFNPSSTSGPVITVAVSNLSAEGVQMIVWLAASAFATSNDEGSLSVWSSASGSWKDLQPALLPYDTAYGVANSGDSFSIGTTLYLVVGHANGYVTIWAGMQDGTGLRLVTAVDVRSSKPVNPWNLHNVRGIAGVLWTDSVGYVVTGSEDGNLCVVRVPDGAIMSTTVYNPAAQRGINSIAMFGQNLLVSNCSVGPGDKNLWYYWVDSNTWSITLRDSTNLKVNPSAPQVFNFCTIWGLYEQGVCFFSSTEEGALWMGTVVDNQRLSVMGYEAVTSALGSALAFNVAGQLVMVSYNLYEFITLPGGSLKGSGNPERLTIPT